ncbi:AAA family ATPase [endosymbiont GvMRE of Glomus versiforme]|uniref:AAA family ATPase n=1 Tax=endosymbiont GvMRE of Glomus versiforme TaxID=2039283 RepID=UPI000ECF2AF0|nr:AAA family ATPase [endosymbiont GvMRE of Glomus versiforme]RHZ37469.1 Lon protease [endosymbiont GvMRE of Glomus versiforme]
MNDYIEEKEKLKKALANLKLTDSIEKVEDKLNEHIGFKREKNIFIPQAKLYLITKGDFWPTREVICFAAEAGMGKTTFVQKLGEAMGRPTEPISCAGLDNPSEYSILGDEKKPSLVAWVIKEKGCRNPIILLDELEKATNEKIQQDLINLFEKYEKGDEIEDKYFQEKIDLSQITFFATVNDKHRLVLRLKSKVSMRELEPYNQEDKEKILQRKSDNIHKSHGVTEGTIIPKKLIELLPDYIQEAGVRQEERALYKAEKDYIYSKEKNQTYSVNQDPKKWLNNNVLAFREEFKVNWKHWFLFASLGINFLFLVGWIFKKFFLKTNHSKEEKNE